MLRILFEQSEILVRKITDMGRQRIIERLEPRIPDVPHRPPSMV
jgi:hypothetical protein